MPPKLPKKVIPMTLREIRTLLQNAGIDNAAGEARILASHFTGLSSARLMAIGEEDLSVPALEEALRRRLNREPLQYILGEWSFMGLPFAVSPACLIPRQDTETLVEEALNLLPSGARVADLCTGSGCIGISLAHYRPDITVTAVELSPDAAAIAEKNAKALGVRQRFSVIRGDVTKPLFAPETVFDCIAANPPYIASDEMETLAPELQFEPRMALTDEGDGLSVICGVLRTAAETLAPRGILLMEFGAAQGAAVLRLAENYGFSGYLLRDAGGNDRVLRARRICQS